MESFYRSILEFEFDEPGVSLTFSQRLAKDNGWSEPFANRVIEEYKKFVYMAVAAGHPVCPSDEVDEAWHLHLTYTRSYWQRLCPLLGRPLHHHPTQGGPAELKKHVAWYQQTLASYRRLFDSEPPRDIWPTVEERFYLGQGCRRINLNTHWVIPKPRLWHVGAMIMAAGAAPAAGMTLNPLNFNGPTFILFYLVLLTLVVGGAASLRQVLRSPAGKAADGELDPYEVAYLAGGKGLAIRAAMASLVNRGALRVRRVKAKALRFFTVTKEFRLLAAKPLNASSPALEQTIHSAAGGDGQSLPKLQQAADNQAAELAQRLRRFGLLLDEGQAAKARWWPALLIAALGLLGVIKIAVGISRGKPIGYLFLAVLGTFFIAALFLRAVSRSRAGDLVLANLRDRHERLNVAAHGPAHDIAATEVVLATALFGMAVVAGGPLDELRTALRAPLNQGGGGGSSGCGGSGCGGSGCGGGGCGGGGCGGCSS